MRRSSGITWTKLPSTQAPAATSHRPAILCLGALPPSSLTQPFPQCCSEHTTQILNLAVKEGSEGMQWRRQGYLPGQDGWRGAGGRPLRVDSGAGNGMMSSLGNPDLPDTLLLPGIPTASHLR
ncbi:hypothetical protein E2C01_009848 [Portunus trituberculatus]|uniref:Uncharacterized protein n=1 Tax=Portunus trituberculatus TaxID=210409 RepID=A0A5B7D6V4_PORTR|nr:hypothetical protein [Portunus trituberculatus]